MLLLLLGCAPSALDTAAVTHTDPLSASWDRGIRDAAGRQVLLRGVNARVEGLFDVSFDDGRLALEEIPSFTAEDCRFLSEELGHNLLRLPINWSAIEPEPGDYRTEYLDEVVALVDDCWEEGVYTIVDLHQDAWSKEIGEDGAPLWAIVPAPTELLEGPLTAEGLAERRTSPAVLAAFYSFFDNAEDLQGAYADMAAVVAAHIAPHPGVAGLELMNEPLALEEDKLADFHARVSERVRAAAPTMTIFFEPDVSRNFTDAAPTERLIGHKDTVYSPHIYTDVFTDGWAERDTAALEASILAADAEARAHGAAAFAGEFGNDPDTETGQLFIATAMDAFDATRMSWAFWLYEEWGQGYWGLYLPGEDHTRGALREELATLLARPYPQAVDAELVGFAWDGEASSLRVELSGAGSGAHRISAPARIWPAGVTAQCDGVEASVSDGTGWIEVPCGGALLELRPR